MEKDTDTTVSPLLQKQLLGFSFVKGVALGAIAGLATSFAAPVVSYYGGFRPHRNFKAALADNKFDMIFDTIVGGIVGGGFQYLTARKWNELIEQEERNCRASPGRP